LQGVRFRCPEGQHNDLATAFFSTADGLLGRMFSVGQDYAGHTQLNNSPGFTQRTLLIYAAVYLIMMALASGVCVPAGLFLPSILLGASSGLTAGLTLQQVLPPHWHIQPGALPLQTHTQVATVTGKFGNKISKLHRALEADTVTPNLTLPDSLL
jgi:H+/Cl- antiporter ClcA